MKDADGKQIVHGIFSAVPYCIDLIGGPYIETNEALVKAFRPKSAIRAKPSASAEVVLALLFVAVHAEAKLLRGHLVEADRLALDLVFALRR